MASTDTENVVHIKKEAEDEDEELRRKENRMKGVGEWALVLNLPADFGSLTLHN